MANPAGNPPANSVAFIGLGIMGKPMAGHLLAAGLPLTVYNRTKSKADDLLARGASGAGQLTKLVNQILVSVTNLATCEALVFAKKNGLDLKKTIDAVAGGAAGSWQLQNLGPRMAAGDFAPGFMVDLQQKDLRLVLQSAEQSNTPLFATSLVHQLFAAAQANGRGRDGTQALFTVLEALASPKGSR